MSTIPLYTRRYIGLRNSCWDEISVFLMVIHDCKLYTYVTTRDFRPRMAQDKEVKKTEETFRNWVSALNNYTEDDLNRLANPYEHCLQEKKKREIFF